MTPIYIQTNLGGLAQVPAFGVMELHFVPEPATMCLLGGGIAALGMAGRRSTRSRS